MHLSTLFSLTSSPVLVMRRTEPYRRVSASGIPDAFARNELLIVILILGMLVSLVFVFTFRVRRVRSHWSCMHNLKQVGLAVRLYADDHRKCVPWGVSTNYGGTREFGAVGDQTFRHFQIQSNYIIASVLLVCPQDTRQVAANFSAMTSTNVSYFVGLDSAPKLPLSIMAGDRNITTASAAILRWNPAAPAEWVKSVGLHGDRGHVVFGDGHVEELSSSDLSNAVQRAGLITNRFAVP